MASRRFLAPAARHGNDNRGYLNHPDRGCPLSADDPEIVARIAARTQMVDEPEAISSTIADEYGQTARAFASLRHLAVIKAREEAREGMTVLQRVADARARAKRQHVNVSSELRFVEYHVKRAEAGGRRVPKAAINVLVRAEAVLDRKPAVFPQ